MGLIVQVGPIGPVVSTPKPDLCMSHPMTEYLVNLLSESETFLRGVKNETLSNRIYLSQPDNQDKLRNTPNSGLTSRIT